MIGSTVVPYRMDAIVYLPKRCAVIQHFARLVCVKMDFDQALAAHCQQAISLKMLADIGVNLVFREIFPFDEKLCIKFIFQHLFLLFFIIPAPVHSVKRWHRVDKKSPA